ncbi:FERM domain-containing protein 5 [Mactra antiquata]
MTLFRKSRSKGDLQQEFQTTVRFLDDSEPIQLPFTKETLGQYVLDKVCDSLNLVEKDYFGLRYVDAEKQRHWLDPTKTVYKQLKGVSPCVLCFRVKFYPADPMKLHEEITRYYLFLQLRRDLHHGRLLCSPQDANLLAAYIIQSEVGDYDPQDHHPNYVTEFKMLPSQNQQQEQQIHEIHKTLVGQVPAEAEANFLKKASSLDTYGVDPHKVKDQKGNQMYLGVTHQGIMTFHGSRRTQIYKWSQIKKLAFEGKTFIAHVNINEKHQPIGYKCLTVAACKYLWRCAVEQQFFFTLQNSFNTPKVRSGGSLFSRGSKFRFSGRCQNEAYIASEDIKRKEPEFQRTCSLPNFARKSDSRLHARNSANLSISEDKGGRGYKENAVDVPRSAVSTESPKVQVPKLGEDVIVAEEMTQVRAGTAYAAAPDMSKQNGGIPIIVTGPSADISREDTSLPYDPEETVYEQDDDDKIAKSLEEQVMDLEKEFQEMQDKNHVESGIQGRNNPSVESSNSQSVSRAAKKGGCSCGKIVAYTFFSLFLTLTVSACVVMFSDIDHPIMNEARNQLSFLEPTRDFLRHQLDNLLSKLKK